MKILDVLKKLHKHDWEFIDIYYGDGNEYAIYIYRCRKCEKIYTSITYIPVEER